MERRESGGLISTISYRDVEFWAINRRSPMSQAVLKDAVPSRDITFPGLHRQGGQVPTGHGRPQESLRPSRCSESARHPAPYTSRQHPYRVPANRFEYRPRQTHWLAPLWPSTVSASYPIDLLSARRKDTKPQLIAGILLATQHSSLTSNLFGWGGRQYTTASLERPLRTSIIWVRIVVNKR